MVCLSLNKINLPLIKNDSNKIHQINFMQSPPILFTAINWKDVPKEEHTGITGTSYWQIIQLPGLRIRVVEYSKDYLADHWCTLGHIVYCVEGAFTNEMEDGTKFEFSKGMTYIVSDEASVHRSYSEKGSKLFIVDGKFLK